MLSSNTWKLNTSCQVHLVQNCLCDMGHWAYKVLSPSDLILFSSKHNFRTLVLIFRAINRSNLSCIKDKHQFVQHHSIYRPLGERPGQTTWKLETGQFPPLITQVKHLFYDRTVKNFFPFCKAKLKNQIQKFLLQHYSDSEKSWEAMQPSTVLVWLFWNQLNQFWNLLFNS